MSEVTGPYLHTGIYATPGTALAGEDTVLLVANEIGSPIYDPSGPPNPGDFGRFTQAVAHHSDFHTVVQHERLGSADHTYNEITGALLSGASRQATIAWQAERVLGHIARHTPNVQRIIALGHSAGAVQIVDMVRAIHEYNLLERVQLGSAALTDMVVFDPPLAYNHYLTGLARFGLYQLYERRLPVPPKAPEQQGTTMGTAERARTDIQYNGRAWVQGVLPNLRWVARHAPSTSAYVAAAAHSPNTMLRFPGHVRRAVAHINGLRGDSQESQPFRAGVFPGPHAAGSRYATMIHLLEHAGVRR